jgi:hypothetical protein
MNSVVIKRAMVSLACAGVLATAGAPARAEQAAGTPAEMVTTYESLADGAAYAHAQVELGRAQSALKADDAAAAQRSIEALAADVAQLASEGDSAVAAVRKRLLEGGHHHHADAEAKGVYDPGFVVVTRAARSAFLDSSRALGQMARAAKAEALEAEWQKVQATWNGLMKPAR